MNLLTKTEDFSDAAWAKVGCTATGNKLVASNGVTLNSTSSYISQIVNVNSAGTNFRILAKAAEFNVLNLRFDNINNLGSPASYARINLTNGTVISSGGGLVGTFSVNAADDGYWEITTDNTYNMTYVGMWPDDTVATVGDGTSGIYILGADLRVANDGTALPDYQRVNTSSDYDTTGFPLYLKFDGSDDYMMTNTITPGTDKAQVFAGVRKLSDAARNLVVEIGNNSNNSFVLDTAVNADATLTGNYYRFISRGTSLAASATLPDYPAPLTNVLTGIGDISGDSAILRVNGVQAASNTDDQGTGNYDAYPLYIGRRGGSSLPFNGRIYSLITRFGDNLTDARIASTEAYVNNKTKAY